MNCWNSGCNSTNESLEWENENFKKYLKIWKEGQNSRKRPLMQIFFACFVGKYPWKNISWCHLGEKIWKEEEERGENGRQKARKGKKKEKRRKQEKIEIKGWNKCKIEFDKSRKTPCRQRGKNIFFGKGGGNRFQTKMKTPALLCSRNP